MPGSTTRPFQATFGRAAHCIDNLSQLRRQGFPLRESGRLTGVFSVRVSQIPDNRLSNSKPFSGLADPNP